MYTTKNIEKFNLNQLKNNVTTSASWHNQYQSAYIFIANLNYKMNEADIVIVFSQFGQVVDIRLERDRQTGKSRGFAFLAYEDQRSTILAVDNFNGTEICGRILRVDHVKKYRPPKQFLDIKDQIQGQQKQYLPTGPDGRGWGKFRKYTEEELIQIKKYKSQKEQKNRLIMQQIGQID